MDILIVKLGALGDVLRTTSLLPPLRRRHRGARIWWATSKAAKPLLEGNPDIHRLAPMTPSWGRRFGLALSLEEDKASARFAFDSCAGKLVGVLPDQTYTPDSALYYGMSLLAPDRAEADRLKAANRLTYAGLWMKILGLPGKAPPPRLMVPRPGRRARVIGFNPGAGARWPAKQLSEAKAASVARALARLAPVVVLGGADEKERNRRIVAMAGPGVSDGGTGHSLRRFAVLLGGFAAIVTSDSLALHIATALGKKVVALIGPTSAAELDVFGRGKKLVAQPCSCFYKPRCLRETSCLDAIPEARVVSAVRALL